MRPVTALTTAAIALALLAGCSSASDVTTAADTHQSSSKTTSAPKATSAPKTEATKSLTLAQKNAVAKVEEYLSSESFSRSGLIDQLKFEGFSKKEATFAVDYVSPNWNKQAAAKAKEYLDTESFSRASLIEQLKFEGFTTKQAEYGAKAVGY